MQTSAVNILDPANLFAHNQQLTGQLHQKTVDLALVSSELNRLKDDYNELHDAFVELKAEHKLKSSELESKSQGLSGFISKPEGMDFLKGLLEAAPGILLGIKELKAPADTGKPKFSDDPAINTAVQQLAELLATLPKPDLENIGSIVAFLANKPTAAPALIAAIKNAQNNDTPNT